ncbi:hypothetical protein HMPREF1092_01514 [Clostridium thermobutyricum]|uniref:Uncharacterized protein n=1 Tax=Clostridium thermobutyricum TaxID=29372 RepID=N9Y292_9CLOT|nr:hypothetical protein [Clostridium thermobutyricum]ENZ02279.1 hypothetical protein HMPREF1092_01514 [Clostridium thermobutyricum]
MEYRLNKIDTDIRRKIKDETKNGKIHKLNKSTEIKINYKDDKEKENKEKNKIVKNYVTIDGYINEKLNIEGEKDIDKDNSIGTILDMKG